MTPLTQLEPLFEQCQRARSQLIQAITEQGPRQAQLYRLPEFLQTRPLEAIEQIEPELVEGSEAHPMAAKALGDLHRKSDDLQSQRVRRYPGLLRFDKSGELPKLIEQLDQRLVRFKTALHALTDGAANVQDARFELLHALSPNLFTMHFYRTPVWLGQRVSRVRFGWVPKRIVAKTDRASILSKLNNALTNPGQPVNDMDAWQAIVLREIKAIQALPDSIPLRIDRPGGLRPTAFVQFEQGGRRQLPANLPLLLAQPTPVRTVALPVWQQSAFPQAKGTLLIPRLHLYRLD
ncbi:DNA replication terminus site-binding protein [Ferrimonas marina]|uniref:DNA replication terminus site binding protein n=1 Tax=Ferrimonas marina TaxID=299255 RepID=A0A1M5NLV6_9GAMM|nr:DNA replication terminus site-binding protein [Ferrimonas marina]SHG90488.1 DNA replication terminus site binding protein [Ferrimonas marina]